MARAASAKAKANVGGNKKAKAASTQKKTKAKNAGGKQTSTPAAVSGADSDLNMKRRLDRRDTDDQADRAMETKFYEKGYSKTVVESLRNKGGDSIQDVVAEEIRRTRGKKKYLTTTFWRRVWEEFDLKMGMFGKLPQQPEYLCSQELEDSLIPAYDDNMATRSITPFLRYLDIASPPLCQEELVAMLHSCTEGPTVTRKQSEKMLLSVLGYIGKHHLQEAFPRIWNLISSDMDAQMTADFKRWPLGADSYLSGHQLALSALIDKDVLRDVTQAVLKHEKISQVGV